MQRAVPAAFGVVPSEHAAEVRSEITAGLDFLGPVDVLVVPTDEDRMIARHAAAVQRDR